MYVSILLYFYHSTYLQYLYVEAISIVACKKYEFILFLCTKLRILLNNNNNKNNNNNNQARSQGGLGDKSPSKLLKLGTKLKIWSDAYWVFFKFSSHFWNLSPPPPKFLATPLPHTFFSWKWNFVFVFVFRHKVFCL